MTGTTTSTSLPCLSGQPQHRCWWRIAFVVYAITVTTLTHWPALDIGEPNVPAPDKIIHLYAFAVMFGLLWRTGWIPNLLLLGVVGIGWVVLDEWSQSMPILRRQATWMDAAAGGMGVIIAVAWLAALKPVGGEANRVRLALQKRIIDGLFATPFSRRGFAAWFLLTVALVSMAYALLRFWPRVLNALPNPGPAWMYGAIEATWLGLLIWVWSRLRQPAAAEAIEVRLCPACGGRGATDRFDEAGFGACGVCGTTVHRGYWLPPAPPSGAIIRRLALLPVVAGFGALIAVYGALTGLFFAIREGWLGGQGDGAFRFVSTMTRDFAMTVDFMLLLLAVALTVFLYRRRLATLYDNQHHFCRACAHDLRATPTSGGIGICGECGASFARMTTGHV